MTKYSLFHTTHSRFVENQAANNKVYENEHKTANANNKVTNRSKSDNFPNSKLLVKFLTDV